jgi:hypothetical protein
VWLLLLLLLVCAAVAALVVASRVLACWSRLRIASMGRRHALLVAVAVAIVAV